MINSKIKKDDSQYINQSVERAFSILQLFLTGERELFASEISKRLSLPQSTIFRFLFTLERSNLVEQNPENNKYRLGVACLELGSAFLKNSDLRQRALPALEALRDETEETVHLGILEEGQGVYIEKCTGLHPIGLMSSHIGGHFPLYSTGLGKVLLAYLPPEAIEEYLSRTKLVLITQNTIVNSEEFCKNLEQITIQGYSIDNEENEIGVVCVGAPIFKHNGLAGAISVSGPARRIHEKISVDNLTNQVTQTAEQISKLLGGGILNKADGRVRQDQAQFKVEESIEDQ